MTIFKIISFFMTRVSKCAALLLTRPNTGVSSFDEEKRDLLGRYNKVTLEEAGKSQARHKCCHPG